MVSGFVKVGLVVVQVLVVEKMNFVVDFTGIVDKEKIVEDMVVGMIHFHNHIFSSLKKVVFCFTKESKFSKE